MTEKNQTASAPHETGENLERGPAEFGDAGRAAPRGARALAWAASLIAVAVAAGFIMSRTGGNEAHADESTTDVAHSGIVNALDAPKVERPTQKTSLPPPPRETAPAPRHIVTPPATVPALVVDKVATRRLSSPLQAENQQQSGSGGPESQAQRVTDAGPMADKLRPLELAPSVAGQLGDRNFLLTQGTMIDCSLQPKLVSTQPGFLTCLATHDVMSANGHVKLIDAGTKFTGYQSGGIVQGQARAFVTWNRLETPTGVILNLGSPGTGPLGEAGLDGAIDNHFGERFGNAILLSLIGDLGNWASNQGQSGDNNVRFDSTREGGQEVISKILEKSIDIPPTLYKNQGERVGIMVARDLDFSKVYDLKPIH